MGGTKSVIIDILGPMHSCWVHKFGRLSYGVFTWDHFSLTINLLILWPLNEEIILRVFSVLEKVWLFNHTKCLWWMQQPRPVSCNSCETKGHVECKWCGGTGFFILGDNMLCQVPSRNTSCVICAGKVDLNPYLYHILVILHWEFIQFSLSLSNIPRGLPAVLIAKELAFAQCGWVSLLYPSSDPVTWVSLLCPSSDPVTWVTRTFLGHEINQRAAAIDVLFHQFSREDHIITRLWLHLLFPVYPYKLYHVNH